MSRQIPLSLLILILVGMALVVLAIITFLWRLRHPSTHFYPNRDSLNKHRGGIKRELSSARSAWVSWWIAAQAQGQDVFDQDCRISKMLLLNPKSPFIELFASMYGVSKDKLVADINEATRLAIICNSRKVEVKYVMTPLLNVTIGNPDSADGWARVETLLPSGKVSAGRRPSYMVYRSEQFDLFNDIIQAFEDVWCNYSEDPPASDLVAD